MSDKMSKATGTSVPNKMRLYATWVDRTPTNCIPRRLEIFVVITNVVYPIQNSWIENVQISDKKYFGLSNMHITLWLCSLTLTRIIILRPLGSDLAAVSIAVKMQSTKRILRSNELVLTQSGVLDAQLDVTFCLQYPHFLKREGNKLHILLQRRKRYKNRTMLGFKTLAEGIIRMDQVLQKQMDFELELLPENNNKEKNISPIARLSVLQLSSTPVDHEHKIREHDFSEDEDEISSGEEEGVDLSDSEPIRKLPHTRHNLKQRFVSLLRRFRVPDNEGGRVRDCLDNPSDIQALFQELESLSCDDDSGEPDTISITSTPKPSLRPFFSSSRSLLDNNSLHFTESEKAEDNSFSDMESIKQLSQLGRHYGTDFDRE